MIEKIAFEINTASLSVKGLPSFGYFFNNSEGGVLKKRAFNIIKNALSEAIPVLGKAANVGADLIFKSGSFDSDYVFNSSITEIILILKAYIEFALKQIPLILNIENIQIIDQTSVELLRQIIENTDSTMHVWEYTSNAAVKIPESVLSERFTIKNVDFEIWDLKKLSFEDYLQIISGKGLDKKSLDAILKYTYIKYNGDLRNLTDTEVLLGIDENVKEIINLVSDDSFNPRGFNINSLVENEKFVLIAIVAHNAQVLIDDLIYLTNAKEVRNLMIDVDLSLAKLEEQELIQRNGNRISIKHDSITREIVSGKEYVRLLFIAYKIWSDYYADLLERNQFFKYSKEHILYLLFHCYLHYSPDKCLTILADIKIIVANAIRPDTAVDYLESVKENLKRSSRTDLDKIYSQLVDIYYGAGIFDKAYNLLPEIHADTSYKKIYHAALLNRLDRHQEAVDYISSVLETGIGKRTELCLKLILLISKRTLLEWDECESIYEDIYGNPAYKEFFEYGFFLRNAEIILPLRPSVLAAQESVVFFAERRSTIQLAHSKITLAMLYAWTSKFAEARQELNEAGELLDGKTLERHIIFNNKAAVALHLNDWDNEIIEEYLQQARMTALTSFDKLAIYSNLLIVYTKTNKHDRGEMVINNILKVMEDEPDHIMHRICYYHISRFYKNHNIDLYLYYQLEAQKVHGAMTSSDDYHLYWENRLFGANHAVEDYATLLIYDYEPCFISYWHFDIPHIEELS
ncbi:hypothetical protein [Mucilaginibacter oryzae]|nr:hypothetical protein [Mucilaginibacter oryzae]